MTTANTTTIPRPELFCDEDGEHLVIPGPEAGWWLVYEARGLELSDNDELNAAGDDDAWAYGAAVVPVWDLAHTVKAPSATAALGDYLEPALSPEALAVVEEEYRRRHPFGVMVQACPDSEE